MHQSPPQIMEHYQNYLLEIGYDAHLKCLTIGRHSTTWLTPTDEPIDTNNDKYQLKPDGSLIIRELDFMDMGTYRCLVKNEFGSDQIETFVYPVTVSTHYVSNVQLSNSNPSFQNCFEFGSLYLVKISLKSQKQKCKIIDYFAFDCWLLKNYKTLRV